MSLAGLVEVIFWLEKVFDRLQLRRSYGGAIAYNYYGPPRLTQDIDVLVLVPDLKAPSLVEEFSAAGCQHGERDPRPPDLRAVLDELRSKAHMTVFRCRGIRTEIFVPWHPFQHRVLDRSPERQLEGRGIRIHAPEDLIVFKKIFDRPKDIEDIKAKCGTTVRHGTVAVVDEPTVEWATRRILTVLALAFNKITQFSKAPLEESVALRLSRGWKLIPGRRQTLDHLRRRPSQEQAREEVHRVADVDLAIAVYVAVPFRGPSSATRRMDEDLLLQEDSGQKRSIDEEPDRNQPLHEISFPFESL